jgi:cyclohexa-1,5-dienecarbonyl-CoA hydratase
MGESIRVLGEGEVVTLTIARPPLNILNIESISEMNEALQSLKEQGDFRVLVLTSEGEKAFSAGVDVADHTKEKAKDMLGLFNRFFFLLDSIEAVTIAAVKGAALGGGCEVAIGCDLIFAADNLKIGQPEIKLSAVAPVACAYLPRLIGLPRANELLLSGEAIDASEALRIGLVNRVVPLADFDKELKSFVGRFSSNSRVGVKYTKKAIRMGLLQGYPQSLDKIADIYIKELMATADANEGLQAFLEKRKPDFKDK